MQNRVIDLFQQSIEAKVSSGELLAPYLEAASVLVANQLLQEHKLLCCGNGSAASLASILTQNLVLGYKMERPGFAALNLATDTGMTSAVLQKKGINDLFVEQVQSLGNKGDLLVTFSLGDEPHNLMRAIQSAHDREMQVIAFFTQNEESIAASLSNSDIALQVPVKEPHSACEVYLLCIHTLCDLIDHQLFGGPA